MSYYNDNSDKNTIENMLEQPNKNDNSSHLKKVSIEKCTQKELHEGFLKNIVKNASELSCTEEYFNSLKENYKHIKGSTEEENYLKTIAMELKQKFSLLEDTLDELSTELTSIGINTSMSDTNIIKASKSLVKSQNYL